jgi:hypothetical protein
MYVLILTTSPNYNFSLSLSRLKSVGPFESAEEAQQYAVDRGFIVDINHSLLWQKQNTGGIPLLKEARIIQMSPPDGSPIPDPG